jgi:phosphatidylglycerol:prolipoprotein diacylglycerol transferase
MFLEFGSVSITWYGVMMASGFLTCMFIWSRLAPKDGRPSEISSSIAFWVMFCGILGARVAYVISDWGHYAANPAEILQVWKGGVIYYGGFIGASLAIIVLSYLNRDKGKLSFYDLAITPIPLGHALGRFGCFMNGCCYGTPTDSPLGICYPHRSWPYHYQLEQGLIGPDALTSLAVHPVQLYEAGLNILLFGLLFWLFDRRTRNGTNLAIYLMSYPLIRFAMEFMRGDERQTIVGGSLHTSQGVSILLFVIGVIIWIKRTKRDKTPAGA